VKSAASCLHTQAILLGFGVSVEARVLSDATAGIGIASRHGCGRVKHLEVRWLWVQEKVISRQILLKKHGTETNSADLGTKYLAKPRMDFLLGLLAMTLVQEAEAAELFMMTASLTGGAVFGPSCIALSLGMAVALGVWFLRETLRSTRATATTSMTREAAATSAAAGRKRSAADSPPPTLEVDIVRSVGFLEFMTEDELRLLLRSRRLRADGSRESLGRRLARHAADRPCQVEFLKFLTVDEMKVLLRARGLRVGGVKQVLSERLARHARVT
jgi:hypothetical protein